MIAFLISTRFECCGRLPQGSAGLQNRHDQSTARGVRQVQAATCTLFDGTDRLSSARSAMFIATPQPRRLLRYVRASRWGSGSSCDSDLETWGTDPLPAPS